MYIVRTRPAPRATPFPYTTLFRSNTWGWGREPEDRSGKPRLQRSGEGTVLAEHDTLGRFHLVTGQGYRARPAPDRKSTRLNSSHGSISYAVFCLKKKNSKLVPAPP